MTRAQSLEAAELAPGDKIGPYRIEGGLGEGGMARVYKAVGPDGEVVAVKLVRADLAVEDMFRRRFAREVRTAERIDHPHVVPVLDSGEHEGVPYMVQPLIRGGALQEKLERDAVLELEAAVTLCLQVAKGVGALHAHGLVHRDLKPANILFDERGCAFVADFGLAKDSDASLITKPGQAVGSLDYMAPEQIRGEEVGPTADVYSLGCVMFECLAGRPPFGDRQGTMKILWAHLRDEPPDPTEGRQDMPKEMSWAVLRALEKDAAQRPATATAYARMVQVAAGVPPLSPGREA
ncbi:MAG: serine/threonine protein kinase [Gemmatimonadetes bacterium]|nr:serine/threonine protein kinase [Gemmatimonadota bacterium]